ncbi:uncharacterized protein LOC112502726 [Cynara cardunculus var. scolymus]|uniref:DNA glycosylase n=1 Tax=Cynara cardunculus var. scolymus TaxID=59895 RepID=A0A103XC49_CYNCS|nr:uncharacterized protein LOC112502726 [Cynara cardunculus var. scolymus]KVH87996.1 DNA glycosylase [Cynara cardunculus var. scolymus]
MCSSKSKLIQPIQVNSKATPAATMVSDINGRPVLQPATSNRVLARCSHKKSPSLPKSASTPPPPPPPPLHANQPEYCTNSSSERLFPSTPIKCTAQKSVIPVKKLKGVTSNNGGGHDHRSSDFISAAVISTNPNSLVKYSSAAIVDAPGSIAAVRRVQVAAIQVQRKMRIAHYGRSKSAKYDSCSKLTSYFDFNSLMNATTGFREEKRCSFITPTSDPIYVGYHDEEWGVPVHDDKLLFELLVLTGAQVGSDWTSVLRRRQKFREAFSEFEAEIVSKFTDKKITSISSCYGIEVGLIRGVVDNSNCILQIKKAFGSFDKYIWGFLNHKPIVTQYKLNQKMPVKSSKSEAISKDMVRRGFRQVSPTVIHSFMQAAGLTNDHLITCPRHLQCGRHPPFSDH